MYPCYSVEFLLKSTLLVRMKRKIYSPLPMRFSTVNYLVQIKGFVVQDTALIVFFIALLPPNSLKLGIFGL